MPNAIDRAPFDPTRSDAFADKLADTINHAGLALMISIGHRVGLFDTMAPMGWTSSPRLASAAGLSERYVREWLGAMTTGGIVEFRVEDKHYFLPAEHAAWLTRSASPNNLATPMQWVAVLGYVEDQVVEAFRHGRGVPYEAYNRFHEVMAEESAQSVVAALDDHILPLIPGLVDRLTHGIDVLDVGCGGGRALSALAKRFPASRLVGRDASAEAIALARAEADLLGLTNVSFEQADVAAMTDRDAFDLITAFDAIHDQAQPDAVLRNIAAGLKPGGLLLMQDISGSSHVHADIAHPFGPFLYTISCMHCMSVSLASGGPGLGAMWGRELAETMLLEAGFTEVRVETLDHDPMNFFYIATSRR